MNAAEHPVQPEEVMAYLDGEVTSEEAARIRQHIATCAACQALSADIRGVSHDMKEWTVTTPPNSLIAPHSAAAHVQASSAAFRASWQTAWITRGLAVAAMVVIVAAAATVLVSRGTKRGISTASGAPAVSADMKVGRTDRPEALELPAGNRAAAAPQASPLTSFVGSPPMIARTATLTLVARDFDPVRAAIERIVRDVNGFASRLDVAGSHGEPRMLTASLRVPADKLESVLTAIKALGQVIAESQAGEDVTAEVIDLDARLLNARNTEKRLVDVLQNRTGKVGDVLEAEREIARVRGEIESMDAMRRNYAQRITYATVNVDVREERKAAMDLGPLPVSTRLRNAIVDGWRAAFASMVDTTLVVARVAPLLLLWALILAWPARKVWRALTSAYPYSTPTPPVR